ncbi:MAG: YbhB/YbcL family Raf kinase inhibitor-like protein [Clostridia bacterium]|nr:YbhB/YbcL family Raf kinase inhibitor-like protein [Clostridia bacterium]
MIIKTNAIQDGRLLDKYGKRGRNQKFGMPTLSFPIEILNYPQNTKSFAIIFDDPDSVKVCGKVWIHWLVANLTRNKLNENDSLNTYDFIQGKNSWNDNCYGGPCPPDAPHNYRLKIYALSEKLDLRGDFSLQQLEKAMTNKILDQIEIFAVYDN